MRLNEISGSSYSYLDIKLELASEDDFVEVEVEVKYSVEPAEYEDGYLMYGATFTPEDYKIKPFKLDDKHYVEITPELVGGIEFHSSVIKQHKALIDRIVKNDYVPTKVETDVLVSAQVDAIFLDESGDLESPRKNYYTGNWL